jgi:CDP-diacylglycerol--serine O-phosphatidyltransferase
MKQIPNLFTLLNLVFGCLAIVCILQTGQDIVYIEATGFTTVDLPEKIALGGIFIFAAAVVDFLDGFIARLFKATSAMGKQLDSLADVVSFGVAPGMILYQILRISFAKEAGGLDVSLLALVPAFLLPCAAAWRLAKFNLDASQTYSFKGVPTPAAGLTVASFPLILHYDQFGLHDLFFNKWFVYITVIFLSYLMISNIPFISLKSKGTGMKNYIPVLILAGIGVIAALLCGWLAVPVVFISYVIVSLAFKNKIA